MKRWIWLIALPLGSLSLLANDARGGGTKVGAPDYDCTISPVQGNDDRVASGALGTVRSEPSSQTTDKWIGCSVDSTPARGDIPGHSMVLCSAFAADEQQLMCASGDPTLVAVVASMNADSYITFTAIRSTLDVPFPPCKHITVENNSKYNTKSP